MLATLRTNVRSPTVFSAFEEGVAAAQDRVSIPIRWRHDMAPEAAGDEEGTAGSFVASCVVALIVTMTGQDDEGVGVISSALSDCQEPLRAAVLLVVAPSSTLEAPAFFHARSQQPLPDLVSLDGVPDMEGFAKVVEHHLAMTASRYLPEAETVDRAQLAALEPSLSDVAGMPSAFISLPGSLS